MFLSKPVYFKSKMQISREIINIRTILNSTRSMMKAMSLPQNLIEYDGKQFFGLFSIIHTGNLLHKFKLKSGWKHTVQWV
ncbi:hypothetical protein L1987_37114 [Smallanthus sonchifolius]|uniref:Uncharacterized protein n=1 Tax=Smallanthus sonchifolius TaxID=185202 RepID=A0ACB9HFF6_9ASTR|nr:hypothetical protein L1987_37114 [Smallanthus sonchifolius]